MDQNETKINFLKDKIWLSCCLFYLINLLFRKIKIDYWSASNKNQNIVLCCLAIKAAALKIRCDGRILFFDIKVFNFLLTVAQLNSNMFKQLDLTSWSDSTSFSKGWINLLHRIPSLNLLSSISVRYCIFNMQSKNEKNKKKNHLQQTNDWFVIWIFSCYK